MLARCQPEPGCEVARPAEVLGRRGERRQRSGDQRTNAGNRHEPPRDLVLARPAGDLRVEPGDPLVEMAQPFYQNL